MGYRQVSQCPLTALPSGSQATTADHATRQAIGELERIQAAVAPPTNGLTEQKVRCSPVLRLYSRRISRLYLVLGAARS